MHKFLDFLNLSPTAWQAVEQCSKKLKAQGFEELAESSPWDLQPGGRYFTIRGGASIAAWIQPEGVTDKCIIAAAHTDSPSLKLKPHCEHVREGLTMLGVEVYGGPLLNSWLNRDLGIAGQISFVDSSGSVRTESIVIDDAPVTIPQLAIHLDREVTSQGLKLNKQDHLNAVAGLAGDKLFLEKVLGGKKLLAHDLFLYPLEKARLMGDLVASYRIDNLSSTFCCLEGLAEQDPSPSTLKVFFSWDHEEIGSGTDRGASSPFAMHTLERIVGREHLLRIIPSSLSLSCDSAHAVHPNYIERHEVSHRPRLGKGPVIKWNSQRRYATDAHTAGTISKVAEDHNLPLQQFVVRSDIACGSTIGPLHSTATGIPTVDIGIPQLSMHGARELAALKDIDTLSHLIKSTFSI
jgi:aspartyl aminopeptidase